MQITTAAGRQPQTRLNIILLSYAYFKYRIVICLPKLMLNREWFISACAFFVCSVLWTTPKALAQTTQGLISGRVVDSSSGGAAAQARIEFENEATSSSGRVQADASGFYVLPLLSP